MIRAGIVGCGKMADQHAVQIRRIPDAEIAAVCDQEPLMAEQMAERFGIANRFEGAKEMLDAVELDVVHITTPPASHFPLARMCLEAGRHVYVEKPFTLIAPEAEDLFRLADAKGLKITAGHNAQFTPAMIRMRQWVQAGWLGGRPVHMESQYCYDLSDPGYAKALLGDHDHWVRKLPGSLLQNIISHGISKIAEFLAGDRPQVVARGFTSRFLEEIGEGGIIDEVRVLIRDEERTTATFTFSSQISPPPHQFRLYGPKNSLVVDDEHQTVIRVGQKDYKSYLRYFIPPVQTAKQHLGNVRWNVGKFVRGEFHLPNDFGLRTLIGKFYDSIARGLPPPLPPREILLTARIMDEIFAQVREQKTLGNPGA
jgi:predicted dehydrogenase